jgi:hypothetical protein
VIVCRIRKLKKATRAEQRAVEPIKEISVPPCPAHAISFSLCVGMMYETVQRVFLILLHWVIVLLNSVRNRFDIVSTSSFVRWPENWSQKNPANPALRRSAFSDRYHGHDLQQRLLASSAKPSRRPLQETAVSSSGKERKDSPVP